MEEKARRSYSPEEKIGLIKRHLLEKVPLSKLCDEHHIHPSMLQRWIHELFEKGDMVFRSGKRGKEKKLEGEIEGLRKKLAEKNEVLGELMEEYVRLKKSIGAGL